VFLNLLRNAIEATPDKGSIDIAMLLADNFLLFRVADTGSGIPAKNLDHVFDLFYTTKPKGTGLGLAICRKIMEDHGGDITIESTEGRGTTVTIKLPYGRSGDQRIPGLPA
jgi:two-component system NtrC family sensor kinase